MCFTALVFSIARENFRILVFSLHISCEKVSMLVNLSRRRFKIPFGSLVDLFLRGVAKLKKLKGGGFIVLSPNLEEICHPYSREVYPSACIPRLGSVAYWIIYKELR